jgi:hypothetical protein
MERLARAVLAVALAVGIPAVPAGAKPPTSPTVGATIRTKRVKVTLHAYRQPVRVSPPVESIAPDTEIAAIDVEACSITGVAQTVGRYQFFLETPDHRLVLPAKTIATPRPQFRASAVTTRHCARGWLSYAMPAGTRAAFVVFQAGAMFTDTLHKWRVPASVSGSG